MKRSCRRPGSSIPAVSILHLVLLLLVPGGAAACRASDPPRTDGGSAADADTGDAASVSCTPLFATNGDADADAAVDADADADAAAPSLALDEPDALGRDADCDGVDGAAGLAVFVSATGVDEDSPSSGTRGSPVRTISFALGLAKLRGKTQVLVAGGTYADSVVVEEGIGVHGGYDPNARWARSASNVTYVVGLGPVLRATDIDVSTRLSRLDFEATDAAMPSESSYGAWFVDSDGVVLEDVTLRAGRGGDGTSSFAASGPAADGGPGGDGPAGGFVTSIAALPYIARTYQTFTTPSFATSILFPCMDGAAIPLNYIYDCVPYAWSSPVGEGAAGAASCPCTDGGAGGLALHPQIAVGSGDPARSARGGSGASGARPDATCTPSAAGGGGAGGSHAFVYSNATQSWAVAPTGASLAPIAGAAGDPGTGGHDGEGAAATRFEAVGFVATHGTAGTAARSGTGGAGGGAGYAAAALQGNATAWLTASGGAGGGGGAGGCGGAAGGAGTGGGASVGLYLWASHPTLIRVRIEADAAGAGGAGAPGQHGGAGGTGGLGGAAGLHPNHADHVIWANLLAGLGALLDASGGAVGGEGGHGGRGGSGGGGSGGSSAAVVLGLCAAWSTSSSYVSLAAGAAGSAGAGGAAGLGGAAGTAFDIVTLP